MIKEEFEFDVLICGGGPGGSTSALAFVNSGLKVGVLEKGIFPRDKICGDALAPYIPKVLDKISPDFGKAFRAFRKAFPVPKVFISTRYGSSDTFTLPENFFYAKRIEFDNFLYELASQLSNVTYFQNTQINEVNIHETHAELISKEGIVFKAKLIVGADGATSILRRRLCNFKKDPSQLSPAIRAYYEGILETKSNTLEVHFSKKHSIGYFWIFPSYGNTCNVGFGIPSDMLKKEKMNLQNEMLELIESDTKLKARFKNAKLLSPIKGWTIPYGYGSHPVSGNRFMLIGDAASLVDPSSGEGVGEAMVSGRLAAVYAIKAFQANDFSAQFMKGYDQVLEHKFGKLLRRRAFLSKILSKYPWLLEVLIICGKAPKWMFKIISFFIIRLAK